MKFALKIVFRTFQLSDWRDLEYKENLDYQVFSWAMFGHFWADSREKIDSSQLSQENFDFDRFFWDKFDFDGFSLANSSDNIDPCSPTKNSLEIRNFLEVHSNFIRFS